jgi:hypothetical protein
MLRLLDFVDFKSWAGNIAHTGLGLAGVAALALSFHAEVLTGGPAGAANATEEGEVLAFSAEDAPLASDVAAVGSPLTLASLSSALKAGPVPDTSIRRAAHDFAKERKCLATGLYYEARGESYAGRLAVAEVVLNRVASSRYPNSICEVVYQGSERLTGCQFSFTCDGMSKTPSDKLAWRKAQRTAQHVLMGMIREPVIGEGVTHYHADYVNPVWAGQLYKVTKIGRHIFYRNNVAGTRS